MLRGISKNFQAIAMARVSKAAPNPMRFDMFKSKLLIGSAAATLAAMVSTPAMAQSDDNLGVEILQLLVDEGIVPFDKAQTILDQARKNAELRAEADAAAKAENVINVPYMAQSVRDDIRDEVRDDVVRTAKQEGWVAPETMPDWVKGIRISGDVRVRAQFDKFAEDNFPYFPDVNAINQAGGVADAEGFPLLNSVYDRNRVNYRARIGVEANVADGIKVGVRLASGDEPGAVSTNSTFGNYFDRNTLWVDQAYVDVQPLKGAHFLAGRMPNPFYSTQLVWDEDINPEGIALKGEHMFTQDFGVEAVAGLFPLEERELYADSYLYAGQLALGFGEGEGPFIKAAGAYYYYDNVQSLKNASDGSRTNDWSAPSYLSKGNSVFNMRTDGLTTLAGLAAEYELISVTAEAGLRRGPLTFMVKGEAVKNLALDVDEIAELRGEEGVAPGDFGWNVRLEAGYPVITTAGQWQFAAGYRSVQTDAVLDIFTDSDFGLGGTDVEGYELQAAVGIHRNTSFGLRWMSSDSIERAPFSVDVLQVELNTSF